MRSDSFSGATTRSLLGLAHNLELEGVEDEETWTALAALGCDIVQGYCLSKPLPAGEFAAWLRDRMLDELTAPTS
ncbi:EAL domain-containing protein [Lentzea aerocolonigenes]|uniref:EAL domain-containing protein n=1 Tax=Lentzea aerocolonigenes TaxID=68170 RepID=UPI0005ECF3D7|nr:EAL domain-containing protein [Lentzea aerocolonigenes]